MTQDLDTADAAAIFDPLRPRLVRLAYRMLGSMADAEDVAQEAFIRWLGTDRTSVREPAAFLRQIATRLCLDHMKSARVRRETYIGPWLPEPVVEPSEETAEDITLPLLMALERLTPLERAAFLLHDVFEVDFNEIAQTLERDPVACRQLASRARTHVRAARPRAALPKEHGLEIARAFYAASRQGDLGALRALLAADVSLQADGGGRAPAALAPILGKAAVVELHGRLAALFAETPSRLVAYAFVNGLPGFVTVEPGGILQTTALQVEDGQVAAVYVVRNPDKLHRVQEMFAERL